MKLNVVGLGHPTKWYVCFQDDFKTKDEAETFRLNLERGQRLASILDKLDLEEIYVRLWNSGQTTLAHKFSELMTRN